MKWRIVNSPSRIGRRATNHTWLHKIALITSRLFSFSSCQPLCSPLKTCKRPKTSRLYLAARERGSAFALLGELMRSRRRRADNSATSGRVQFYFIRFYARRLVAHTCLPTCPLLWAELDRRRNARSLNVRRFLAGARLATTTTMRASTQIAQLAAALISSGRAFEDSAALQTCKPPPLA